MSTGMLGNSESLRRIIAGPISDLLVKLNGPDGSQYEKALNNLLRREDFQWGPQFERNQHGHITFTVTGVNLTGVQEIARLEAAKYRVGDYARQCLLSTREDGYDAKHRLENGKIYTIALISGKEIATDAERTTANVQKLAESFGYQKPLAGVIPRIREAISDHQMEDMGIWYIAGLHEPIKGSDGVPRVLFARRGDGGRWLGGYWGGSGSQWSDDGAFAFLVPAS